MFHIYPGFMGVPELSDSDKDTLKYVQSLIKKSQLRKYKNNRMYNY